MSASDLSAGDALGNTAQSTPYQMTDKDKEAVAAHDMREHARRKIPTVKLDLKDNAAKVTMAPMAGGFENDSTASRVAMARFTELFGGASLESASHLLGHVMGSVRRKDGDLSEGVNARLALIAGIAPRDELEAMLAVQMVGTHGLICEFQRRLLNSVETIPQQDSTGNLLAKLQRTFIAQMETLKRYRTGGEQRVSVLHQHVNVTADKAAVAINAPNGAAGGPGVPEISKEQPHEPEQQQITHEPGAPLPSALQTDREVMPKPRR